MSTKTRDRLTARIERVEDLDAGDTVRYAVLSDGRAVSEPEYRRPYVGTFGRGTPVYGDRPRWHAGVGRIEDGVFFAAADGDSAHVYPGDPAFDAAALAFAGLGSSTVDELIRANLADLYDDSAAAPKLGLLVLADALDEAGRADEVRLILDNTVVAVRRGKVVPT